MLRVVPLIVIVACGAGRSATPATSHESVPAAPVSHESVPSAPAAPRVELADITIVENVTHSLALDGTLEIEAKGNVLRIGKLSADGTFTAAFGRSGQLKADGTYVVDDRVLFRLEGATLVIADRRMTVLLDGKVEGFPGYAMVKGATTPSRARTAALMIGLFISTNP